MTQDELYKIAIKGRKTHLKTYHFWMNMYAIINGALFVGLYNVFDKNNFFSFVIMTLGCLAGWFWYLSVRGFHAWIVSWIKNIQRFENEDGVYKAFCNVEFDANKPIRPLSTPKLTKGFTLGVAVLWSFLTLYQFYKINSGFFNKFCANFSGDKDFIKFIITIILLLLLIIFILANATCGSKESDLRDTNDVVDCKNNQS